MNGKRGLLNGKTVVFFGTSKFGLSSLQTLFEEGAEIKLVVTANAKPAGRGKKLQNTPIHEKTSSLSLPIYNTAKPEAEKIPESFDYGIVISYGAIIPSSILNKAKYGFLNLHPSNLPLFRGAAPIERTLEAGHNETRICVIKMTPKLDDGDIILYENYKITQDENSLILHEKFEIIGSKLIPKAMILLEQGGDFEKQNHQNTTYAKKITKEELEITKTEMQNKTATELLNKVRAFASYGFPFFIFNGIRIKIIKAEVLNIKKTMLDMETKEGFLSPITIKPEGKKEMPVKDFLLGVKL